MLVGQEDSGPVEHQLALEYLECGRIATMLAQPWQQWTPLKKKDIKVVWTDLATRLLQLNHIKICIYLEFFQAELQ